MRSWQRCLKASDFCTAFSSPVRPNRLCGGGPMSGLMARRSCGFLNQPISFLLCASPRRRGPSAQPNRKALVPWTRSVSPRATAEAVPCVCEQMEIRSEGNKSRRDKTQLKGCQTWTRGPSHKSINTLPVGERASSDCAISPQGPECAEATC